MRVIDILEARKNPDVNYKTAVNDHILNHLDNAEILSGTNETNSFVSFTSIDKLGVNPQSEHNTPLGIYAYPSSYIENSVGPERTMSRLPFAGDSKYANIFSVKGNIINLDLLEKSQIDQYYQKLDLFLIKFYGRSKIKSYIKYCGPDANVQTDAGIFWYVTYEIANDLATSGRIKGKTPVVWNYLFRKILGIDGFIDPGLGIIHKNEPTQVVFFSKSAIYNIDRVYNKYSKDHIDSRKRAGEWNKVSQSNVKSLNYAKLVDSLLVDPRLIQYVKPTSTLSQQEVRDLQNIAIAHGAYKLGLYWNPEPKQVELLIKENPLNILYFKNPSTDLMNLALKYANSSSQRLRIADKFMHHPAVVALRKQQQNSWFG